MPEQPVAQEATAEAKVNAFVEPEEPIKAELPKQPTKPDVSQRTTAKNGRDEMNLAEYPFALLSTRSNPNVKTITITKQGTNKKGEVIEQKWIVTGSDQFGLPTIVAEEVYVALMAMTHSSGFTNQEIEFQGAEALRQLGWPLEGKSYWRLRKALRVLSGVNIYAQNMFYDNKTKDYLPERKFSIISNYDWHGDEKKTIKVNWDKFIWSSIKNNYIKALDTDLYKSLNSAIAKRLYRILDKRFYHKTRLEFDLKELAFDHLNMSRKYHGGKIKERLKPAIEELIQSGYIKSFEFQPPKGRTKTIIFYKNTQRQAVAKPIEQPTETGDSKRLIFALVKYGIPESTAQQLVQSYHDRIENQVKYHEYRLQLHTEQVSKNPAGFLRTAIEGNWAAPADYTSPEEQQRRVEKQAERQSRQEHQFQVEQYREWIEMTPEEKVRGELWVWDNQYRKVHNHPPSPDEKQAKQQELIEQLPTDEEKQTQIFGKPFKETQELFE